MAISNRSSSGLVLNSEGFSASSSSDKQGHIVLNLCQRIRAGEFKPGEQLPLYTQLEQQYEVSRVTLQHAMNRLKREGFIRTAGRRGAFVADYPPCLCRYGLVLPTAGHDPSGLWLALQKVASDHYRSSRGKHIVMYQDVTIHVDNESFQRLATDVQQQRLAGLILVGGHGAVFDMADWFSPDMPGVWFNPHQVPTKLGEDGRIKIELDTHLFRVKALDYLVQQECGKIAVIGQPFEPYIKALAQEIASRDLPVYEHWMLRAALEQPQCARDLARLLFASSDRPDGLVILADNLVEQTMLGIIDARAHVPEELKIVAHCNWPLPPPQILPARLLGYEASEILQYSIEQIDHVRQYREVASQKAIAPRFSDECLGADALHWNAC